MQKYEFMMTREGIVGNWLQRYTGMKLEDFGEHILLRTLIIMWIFSVIRWRQNRLGLALI